MRNKIFIITVVSIIIITFFGIGIYNDIKSRCIYYNRSFSGKISEIEYDEKKFVQIKFKDSTNWLYLGSNITYDIDIEIGDSISKDSQSYKTLLHKYGKVYDISSKREEAKYFNFYCRCKNK